MPADLDVFQGENGILPDGSPRPWAFVRGRARKVLGDVIKKKPFTRRLANGTQVAATTSQYDHDILTAEQVGWRYVDSLGNVWDLGDFMLVCIERMVIDLGADKVNELRARASQLRAWPPNHPGRPDFE